MSELQINFSSEQLNYLSQELKRFLDDKIDRLMEFNTQPYLNQKEFCNWAGITSPTVRKFVKQGLPVANINGQKLYGKESYIKWLKNKEE